jgi:hypothetical protein
MSQSEVRLFFFLEPIFPASMSATQSEELDLNSLIDLMIAGEDDEREAGAFAIAEFVSESESHQVWKFSVTTKFRDVQN